MKKNKNFLAAILIIGMGIISCKNGESRTDAAKTDSVNTTAIAPKDSSAHKAVYVCPMHPEEVSDKPAKCSKCGMDLELKS